MKIQNPEQRNKDGFRFQAEASVQNRVVIKLKFEEIQGYALSENLAKFMGKKVAKRQEIISTIWEYIKVRFFLCRMAI
jgi:chromatin remodeling complex protein RSC6